MLHNHQYQKIKKIKNVQKQKYCSQQMMKQKYFSLR